MPEQPSGTQWVIAHGAQEATIVEVGGGLRTYRVGDVDVLAGYPLDAQCSEGRGQLLIPWPNRIRDGRYDFNGATYQLALTEPARGNANHGLVRWASWSLREHDGSSLTVGYRLHPQPGWSGILDLAVTYALSDSGLSVLTHARNVGPVRVPFGCGAHPYIAIGDTTLSEVELTIPASTQVLVDADRLLPINESPVTTDGRDFRTARPLGDTRLDTAFTGLDRDAHALWHVSVGGLINRPDVGLWADESFDWVQVFTGNAEDPGGSGSTGIAIEPLTCPADAFNSGAGLITLEPGGEWTGRWGLSIRP